MQEERAVERVLVVPDDDLRGRRSPGRVALSILATLAFLFSVLAPAPAGAQSAGRVTISGDALPSDCNNGRGLGALALTGDLEGCLTYFPKTAVCTEMNGFALYEETGREIFKGKYQGEPGRFKTRYTLASTWTQGSCEGIDAAIAGTGDFPYANQLTGGCDHKIIGRRGAFEGMRGLITFYDVIPEAGVSGASNFFYSGHLR